MPPGNHAHIRFFVDAGSCVTKVGVYAVLGNPVLLHNLKAFLKGENCRTSTEAVTISLSLILVTEKECSGLARTAVSYAAG